MNSAVRGDIPSVQDVTEVLATFERLQAAGALYEKEQTPLRHLADWLAARVLPALRGAAAADGGGADCARRTPSFGLSRLQLDAAQRLQLLAAAEGGGGDGRRRWGPELEAELAKLDSWDDFDVFRVAELSGGRPLEVVALAALERLGLMAALALPRDKVTRYVQSIERLYRSPNPYHCATHAADVVQTVASLLLRDDLTERLSPLELLACVLAAVVHDVDHRGVNNEFLIKTRDDLALTYNDLSVNESHHLATAFRVMRQPGCDVLSHLSPDDFALVRGLVVDVVKATDMQEHHRLAAALKDDLHTLGPDLATWDAVARGHAVAALMHCADISNAAKPARLTIEWARRVTEEFWQQGDKERSLGLPVQPLFDRTRPNVPASQVAFLQLFVKPSFELLSHIAPTSCAAALQHFDTNLARWQALAKQGERGFGADAAADFSGGRGGGGAGGGGGANGRRAAE